MNILITGGTGFVGSELRNELLKEGHNLTIISRSPGKYEKEAAKNQQFISWDGNLVKAMDTADAVINLAGENLFGQRWTDEVKERILKSRTETTKKLVDAMRAASEKPGILISASASGIYGNRGEDIVDEEEKPGDDFLAEVCIAWEDEARKAEELGVRVAIPRIGIVLEKGGGALEKMIPPFRFFVGGPIGSGDQYMSWVHLEDLCRGIMFPLLNKEFSGAYNMCAPNPATMDAFSHTLGKVMNRPSIFRVPETVLSIVLGEAAKPVTDSIRMQPKKLQVAGFDFHYEELEEALADIL